MGMRFLRRIFPGIFSGGFQVITAEGELNLVVNAYYDESTGNWYRIDESKRAWRIGLIKGGAVKIDRVEAGTGAITWSTGFNLDSGFNLTLTKITKIKSYSQTTEPDIDTDTVALWEDTANNRYWFIWDKGGTQRKVELT